MIHTSKKAFNFRARRCNCTPTFCIKRPNSKEGKSWKRVRCMTLDIAQGGDEKKNKSRCIQLTIGYQRLSCCRKLVDIFCWLEWKCAEGLFPHPMWILEKLDKWIPYMHHLCTSKCIICNYTQYIHTYMYDICSKHCMNWISGHVIQWNLKVFNFLYVVWILHQKSRRSLYTCFPCLRAFFPRKKLFLIK